MALAARFLRRFYNGLFAVKYRLVAAGIALAAAVGSTAAAAPSEGVTLRMVRSYDPACGCYKIEFSGEISSRTDNGMSGLLGMSCDKGSGFSVQPCGEPAFAQSFDAPRKIGMRMFVSLGPGSKKVLRPGGQTVLAAVLVPDEPALFARALGFGVCVLVGCGLRPLQRVGQKTRMAPSRKNVAPRLVLASAPPHTSNLPSKFATTTPRRGDSGGEGTRFHSPVEKLQTKTTNVSSSS
jgi:hypothetical protein